MLSSSVIGRPPAKRSLRAWLKSSKSLSFILQSPTTGTLLLADLQYATASNTSTNLVYDIPYRPKFGAGTNPLVVVAHSDWPCARHAGRSERQRSLAAGASARDGSSSRVKRSGAREHRAGEKGAAYLTTVQRGRDEQSVPQKPLAHGDFLPPRIPVRHETVRAVDVLLGDARVHVAKQPEQAEVIEVEADELGLPDAIARRGAVVLSHDFPGRVVHGHRFANLPVELRLRLPPATRVALLARLLGGVVVFLVEEVINVVVIVVGHEVLFSTAKRALDLVPTVLGVGAAEVVRVVVVPVRVVVVRRQRRILLQRPARFKKEG
jgi:hypothetical protein